MNEYQLVGGPLCGTILKAVVPKDELRIKVKHRDESRYAIYKLNGNRYNYIKSEFSIDLVPNKEAEVKFADVCRSFTPAEWKGPAWTVWTLK